jgi:ribosomal protein L7Ae-like RNA K-turn-binding protein
LLGIARRSGVLLLGQDQVLRSLGRRLFVVTVPDCSPAVLRKLDARSGENLVCCVLSGTSRAELGRSLGVSGAQIAALPLESGFAKKLAVLLQQEGLGIDE